jgi:myosin heavy subunit
MQEIVLILSSLAGVATAAAVRKIPRDKNQLLSLGASSHIKSQITSLKIEKDILTKTISRLYQAEAEFSKIQKDKLLLKYQHQLGTVLARLEKLEQASNHPDLGPVGDGLITLMDQKLSKLDDRLYELSSKMVSAKVETPMVQVPEIKQETKQWISNAFNFDKPKESRMKPIEIPPTKSRQSFELTTLTNISRKESKFPSFEEAKQVAKPMPQPRIIQEELIKPRDEIVQEIIQPNQKVEDKMEIIQSVMPKPEVRFGTKPDLNKEVAKITEYKALPEPIKEKPVTLDDDFDEDADDLDKIKGDIMRVLSKLDQAEVE